MCISLRVCACVIQHDLLMHVNNVVVYLAILLCLNSLQRGMSTTGYGPRRTLVFDGDEQKYELWEVKFLGHLRLQKLYDVVIPTAGSTGAPDADKNANAFAELVQCLDDRSLALVIREAKDDGRKALAVLREHYQGKGKPRVIALYTELTSLRLRDDESATDYVIRAEKTATALKAAGETISDGLLVAMVMKGLPENFKTFSTVISQRQTQITFSEFKTALRNFEETERSCSKTSEKGDNVMAMKKKFHGSCFKCGRKGHKSSECQSRQTRNKWCTRCRNSSHNTLDCQRKEGDTAKKTEDKPREDNENNAFLFTFQDQGDDKNGMRTSTLLLDSGATSHIVVDRRNFVSFDENFKADNHFIELADGSRANVVLGKGNARFQLHDVNGNPHEVTLSNALYIPSYKQNIFSVSAAIDKGASINLDKGGKYFKARDGTTFDIQQKGRLYYLNSISSSQNNASSLLDWHRILGHCNFEDLRRLSGVVKGMKVSSDQSHECVICSQGKMCQTRSRVPDRRAKMPLEFVHCDLAGPIEPMAKGGFKYALCFVDDFTGIHKVYFLKQKSDTVEATQQFLADVAPFGNVKRMRSDNGGEFTSKDFRTLLLRNKIKHETCAPYSPHQNGTVERAWRSLFEMARCLLIESKLPKRLWAYAVRTAAHIRNRCFNRRLGRTPYEALIGKKPDLSNMHIFGSECYAYVQSAKKLEARSKKGVFVGYDDRSPAYLVFYPDSDAIERVRCVKVIDESIGRHMLEEYEDSMVSPLPPKENSVGDETGDSRDAKFTEGNESRYPKRVHSRPKRYGQDEYVSGSDFEDSTNCTVDYCYRAANIPTNYEDALASTEAAKWQRAMSDEMIALTENETFELVKLPRGRQVVGGRWVFAVKTGPNGEETHKARYVAKGYSQIADIDYQETFAPTARMSSVRTLMQKAVQNEMITHQMDVKTAYLNAPIDCEIYIEQPQGFEERDENGDTFVCKLKKSLYGLKQSGRNWNNMLHTYLISENFSQSLADPCLYTKKVEPSESVILIVWVDDIIISGTTLGVLESVKSALSRKFKMKDLGNLSWFLGTSFECNEGSVIMSQKQYVEKILSKFNMADCKPKPIPCVSGAEKESENVDSPLLDDPKLYRAIVGSLIYVMTGTRPDICYAVTKLSQNMAKPTQSDLSMAKNVLRYLKGSIERGLTFQRSELPLKLTGFCDSDWGASVKDRRSITGYSFQLSNNGPIISWKSKKQQTVALSTCEAEYISLENAVQEAKFLKQLCNDMDILIKNVLINVDNQGTVNLAKNPINHQRSKHIDIKYHFIRLEIQIGNINLQYVPTDCNVADIFTKPVTKIKLEKFRSLIMGK